MILIINAMKRILIISLLGIGLLLPSCGKHCGSSLHFDADSARVLIENAIQDSLDRKSVV